MSVKDDVAVDKYALDIEWEKQPTLYQMYLDQAVELRKEVTECQKQLDLVEAKLSLDIKKNPSLYGLDKVVESSVQAVLILHPDRQKAYDDLIQRQYEKNLIDDVVKALEHKKSALEELVRLYLSGYYSRPTVNSQERKQAHTHEVQVEALNNIGTRRRVI